MSLRLTPGTGTRLGWIRRLLGSWTAVMTAPSRFFRTTVTAGDQAPGLLFAAAVVLVALLGRFATDPGWIPVFRDRRLLSAIVVLGIAVVLVTPLVLHLVAALQTVVLVVCAPNRRGISETVQVIGYASAPCVFAGLSMPTVTVVATAYGTLLLVIGTATVHGLSAVRSIVVSAVPAFVVFGLGFGGINALMTVLRWWYII